MTKEELGQELYRRRQGILEGIGKSLIGEMEAGKNLMVIKQKRLYRADGNHVTSFGQWVEGELGISRSTAYQKIDVYDKFSDLVGNADFATIDYSKLVLLSRLVTESTTLAEKEDLLHMAVGQTVRGLRDNIREKQGKVATDVCSHKPENQEAWNKCKDCGKFWR